MSFRKLIPTVLALPLIAIALPPTTANATDWDAVAQCESGGNWSTNTGNGFAGGLQFTQSTWRANGGSGSPSTASREQQIRVAERVAQTQGMGAWPTCGSKSGSHRSGNAAAHPRTIPKAPTTTHKSKGTVAPPRATSSTVYVVRAGDTLSGIASRHGTSWEALATQNKLANPNMILIGQRITL